ncbi:pyridoxamine 5'-phosphate oxidase family protein [Mesobacillus harenae]|uniref:pyridoxamine 5'-phosphate oxidase family protein n=1 Tax=Mesobacillus harenae TaxID=2213203 RepID=UPI001580F488|nr:pyridoxamine 5'-phosphate oxidase family protein [Mesobacillus harenae]
MDQKSLKEQVLKVLENNHVGTLATVEKNKPHSRYMTFFNDDLKLYTPTSKQTYKVEELEENPYVHILLGYNGDGRGDAYVEAEGKTVINEDQELKKKLWNEEMKPWIESPDDPDYVVLEIDLSMVRFMNGNDHSGEVLEL